MTESELENSITEAKNSLEKIVSEAEKLIFSFGGGWSDACGKKISGTLISTVQDAVDKNLNLYDCEAKLEKISDDITPLIGIIEAAKRELQ